MSGPGCFIIINCGMPKGSANGLLSMYSSGNVAMRCAAATMRDKLDEVCRFGAAIVSSATALDQDDMQKIYDLNAKDLGIDIDAYLLAHSQDHSFEHIDASGVALLGRIKTFNTAIRDVFESIVAEYGPQHKAAT